MDLSLESLNQLASLIVGGGVVTGFWAWRTDRLAQYRYLDEVYTSLLAAYRDKPEYGDGTKTPSFDTAYGDKALEYHFFAMSAMNTMETIFDVLHGNPMRYPQWKSIFAFHVRLHWAWLRANQSAFEKRFVTYCETRTAQ